MTVVNFTEEKPDTILKLIPPPLKLSNTKNNNNKNNNNKSSSTTINQINPYLLSLNSPEKDKKHSNDFITYFFFHFLLS